MKSFAVIFDWFPTTPVYHAFGDLNHVDDDGIRRSYTRCHRVVSEYDGERLREPGDWIPVRHARKFGRPCFKCHPTFERVNSGV